jgi:hypothetical protein
MRNAAANASFDVNGIKSGSMAEVIGENRRINVKNGRFDDQFKPYEVHLYRLQQ